MHIEKFNSKNNNAQRLSKSRIVQEGLTFDGTLSEKQISYATTYFENVFPRKKHNTLTSYDSDLIIFKQFCSDNHYPMISADIDLLRNILMHYIDFLAGRNRKSTVGRRLSTLTIMFDVCGLPNLLKTDRILHDYKKEVFSNMSGYQTQANAFDDELIDEVNEKFVVETLKDFRDLAMINCMFSGLLRNNEVRRMHYEHINQTTGALFLPDSKADKKNEGTGRFLTSESINMINDWCSEAKITSGPIWRTISPKGTSLTVRTDDLYLSDQAITDAIKRVIVRVRGPGADKGFSSHSLRVGAAITLFRHNIPIPAIANAGGWASDAMVLKYVRELTPAQNGMAQYAKNKKNNLY